MNSREFTQRLLSQHASEKEIELRIAEGVKAFADKLQEVRNKDALEFASLLESKRDNREELLTLAIDKLYDVGYYEAAVILRTVLL